jgi:hypothetical protein
MNRIDFRLPGYLLPNAPLLSGELALCFCGSNGPLHLCSIEQAWSSVDPTVNAGPTLWPEVSVLDSVVDVTVPFAHAALSSLTQLTRITTAKKEMASRTPSKSTHHFPHGLLIFGLLSHKTRNDLVCFLLFLWRSVTIHSSFPSLLSFLNCLLSISATMISALTAVVAEHLKWPILYELMSTFSA